ncbi:hypothetical protein [Aureibaculum luteum]|uniref:hypothetical protein n=1 Tax=Aureibaculum luteum TaxID=1548456 RepID=UPI000E52D72A|nr:hypothetical protein [Aureibaculum luteum]
MTARNFRILVFLLAFILGITSIFLVWFSFEAAAETENWSFMDFDFSKKEGIISSYGSLLAAILSFVAILLVLLDLFYQRRLKTIEAEDKETEVIDSYRDNLNIIILFIEQLCQDVISQSKIANDYVKKEKNNPTEPNRMSFVSNAYPKLILDVDRNRFYNSIQHFKPSENWKKLYVNIYKITDFYDKSFEDIKKKHQIHLDKKFKHCIDLGKTLDEIIDINSEIRNNIINECKANETHSTENPYFGVLQFIKEKAIEIISRRTNAEDRLNDDYINPTSLTVWRDEVFQVAFNEIISLWNINGHDNYNLKLLLNKIQFYLREYSRLIQDSEDYSKHVEIYFNDNYSEDSSYVKKLKEIIESIEKVLD